MNEVQRIKQAVDIGKLQTSVESLEKNVDVIMSNHLPHLQEELEKVKLHLARWAGGITVATFVANWLFK